MAGVDIVLLFCRFNNNRVPLLLFSTDMIYVFERRRACLCALLINLFPFFFNQSDRCRQYRPQTEKQLVLAQIGKPFLVIFFITDFKLAHLA